MKTFILMLYIHTTSVHAGGAITMQEFSSFDRCEIAALTAKKRFEGFTSTVYFACVEK